jgi:S-adenosylmethionine-dependent methyltransferase
VLRRLVYRQIPECRAPEHLVANHSVIDDAGIAELRRSIENNYHVGWRSPEAYSDDGLKRDLDAHLFKRLERDRNVIAPWLDSLRPLTGLKVLEIGGGTGSSTVALAEQGAHVVAIDVDEGALRVARDRCRIYGVTADIRVMNADQIDQEFRSGVFDMVIFFACLEHMTVSERLTALSKAWDILPTDGMLAVIETPNRLWFFDHHTAQMPFFQWLPDELAFEYSRFSPRENFREVYRERTPESLMHFLRRGRGASFHEFDLAIRPVRNLEVVGSLASFLEGMGIPWQSASEAAFSDLLRQQSPAIPAAFFEKDLDLVIQKTTSGDQQEGSVTAARED